MDCVELKCIYPIIGKKYGNFNILFLVLNALSFEIQQV